MNITIPKDFEVQPLRDGDNPPGKTTCGTCGLSWDDDKPTSLTPAPSARCPFEYFHDYKEYHQEVSHADTLAEAAPDLLKAAKLALNELNRLQIDEDMGSLEAMVSLDKAISKAEGADGNS